MLAFLFAITSIVMATGPGVYADREELAMAARINQIRENHNKEPLRLDPILMQVAHRRCHAYNHCQNGKWMWDACRDAGYSGKWASDDIAKGYMSGEEAVDGWETSDGHLRQMLGQFRMDNRWQDYHFCRLGVAYDFSNRTYIAVFGN
jgi:uncharacterized protein YkwD